ncbi:unnamed protein product [Rangifer tarandus platyrhynchus]|uniref:Uncharacterized protein n=1 Tax=Rangifer tarandus platyrhynchus TaxID=3082113 RepID=A0ACB1KGW8_RANTA
MNHPQVSIVISTQDEDFLSYMIDLNVRVWSLPRSRCNLIFSFRDNLYFWNMVLIKECYLDITGYRACRSTLIIAEDMWDDPLKYYPREEGSAMRGK